MKGDDFMKNYTVYMHISPSNKKYIGITSQKPEHRWQSGKGYKGNKHFFRAIQKYGWNNFEHIIVAKKLTEDEAKWLEIELIKEWGSTNPNRGYNISHGGDTGNHLMGVLNPMYGKLKGRNNPMYGKHHTEETKRKISEINRKYRPTEETKRKISKSTRGENNPFYGKTHTEEAKRKMSIAKKKLVKGKHPHAKKVICLTTKEIFGSLSEGSEKYNCHTSEIAYCCRGYRFKGGRKYKVKSAGRHPFLGKKLVWRYLIHNHNKTYRIKKL